MENNKLTNAQDIMIQGLLDRYLRLQSSSARIAQPEQHLDEDTLAVFIEGGLTEREAQPLVKHLVNCSFCRHVTKELVRLDLAFADDEVRMPVAENQPSKISEVLNNLLSRIFGTSDNAVFAHQEDSEKTKETEEEKN